MPGIDTSIYGQIAPPADPFALPNKLLGLQQGVLGTQNAQIQNQLLQRNLSGQQALQGALSDATDPVTGQIDTNKLVGGLRGTPGANLMPDAIQQGQHIVGGNITNQGAAQGLNTAQIATLGQSYGATLQGGGAFGRKEAIAGISAAVLAKQMDPIVGNTLLHQMPRTDAGAKAWANSLFLRTMPSASNAQPADVDPATGRPITLTAGQVFTKAVNAMPPTDASGNALNPDGTPTSANLNQKTGIVTPPAARPAPMGYPSGLAPGQASSADISAQGAATQAAAFERQANSAPEIKADIENAQAKLDKIATGPLADKIYKAKSGVNELVDASGLPLPGWDKEGVANLEEFRKLAQNIAVRQFSVLGGTGTDSQLSAVTGANPGTALSNLTNKQMLQMLQGNQDAIQAKTTAWRQYQKQAGATAANFNTFSEDFNNHFAPRAFQFVHMTPGERKDMVKNMTPVEKGQLNTALQTAMDRGWINSPGAAK